MGNHVLATTTNSDENDETRKPGAITEVSFRKLMIYRHNIPRWLSQSRMLGAHVECINVRGKVLGEPVDIPGVGSYVSFFDTEGNRGYDSTDSLRLCNPYQCRRLVKYIRFRKVIFEFFSAIILRFIEHV